MSRELMKRNCFLNQKVDAKGCTALMLAAAAGTTRS